ncbi:G-type lectin S-receptor-like serine/threonine-protein kinase B120 isoform X1 [Zingiber officinale]|uniref:G-type lectin S-receptor-like serine/threonine-protein kinase B120 isoform X1 n=1 Tax=Zingiber officinale TaxID=94328 RepID=UPI001C4B6835|nr:G-type lectin S-receptor-like serine/threonine-protein kinase B120 isoform X1 [Zingiber officinale]XP_042463303.1 G-type lectin S-receptor-like serine/threonine-protein kinase B120 isoform X1 [Zingiber officinale]
MGRMQLFLLQFLEIVLVETFFLLGQSSSGELVAQFDIMAGNSSLINNQTLISAGSMFQLGFFSPVNNSATAYIGIWYYNHPPRENKVVWVANRDKSVDASMASLNLTSDGNLILFEEGTKVWSTGTSAELNSARLQLLDSGNLALTAGNSNRTVWQSFDHACDTILPGMKLGFDFRTNTPWQFVSWMSATDPSPGKYIVKMETYKVPDFLILSVKGSAKLGRTGPWNGQWLVDLPMLRNVLNLIYVSNQNETYYITEYQIRSPVLVRMVLDANGKRYLLIFDGREWNSFLSLPRDDCDNYNSCGNNSVCTKGYYSISCRCLEGFVEIGSVVGCKRKEPFRCSSNQFRKEPSVKVPDTENATSRGKISLEACNKLCLDDCSCVAYAVINGPYGCITWRGDLLDLRSFPDGGDDLYIRLQESSTSNRKELMLAIVVILVLLGIFLLCFVGVLVRKWRNRASTCRLQLQFPNMEKGSISALDVLPSYDLHTIKIATNDFSEENKLGEGGFGAVYKGQLDDGQKIAVKKLSRYSSQGPNEFLNELSVIAKLQHTNLVRLLGYCIEGDERIMILEYMENKSLDAFIYDKAKSSLLNWQRRFDIIIGIARGLLYLHQDSRLKVIHRDLKPSNILLDKDMNPKISDFGIARIFKGDQSEPLVTWHLSTCHMEFFHSSQICLASVS